MGCGCMQISVLDETRGSHQWQREHYGFVVTKRSDVFCGDVALHIGSHIDVWNSQEDFVEFWKQMSDQRIAAYCASVFCAKRPVANWNSARCWIEGTLKTTDFERLAASKPC